MSTAENKALIKALFDDLAKGDPTRFLQHLAEDASFTITGSNSWSRTHRGKANIRRDLWGYVNALLAEPGRTTPQRILADEDWVIVEARGNMMTAKGERYDNHYCLLYRLEKGMIVEMKEYQDSALCERVLGPYPADGAAAAKA